MAHWFMTPGSEPESWQQAFPEASVLSATELARFHPAIGDTVWVRLASEQTPVSALQTIQVPSGVPLVVLSDQPDETVALASLAAGASGCCNSHAAPEVLRQVALVVGNGGLWVGQGLMQRLVGGAARALAGSPAAVASDDWAKPLSEREQEVAQRVAQGASNKEIAAQLDISERTVKAHLGAIFEKLGVRDRLQLSLRVNGNR